jgi:hypothetical protein
MGIDYWSLTKEFAAGDMVQRFAPGQGGYSLSPFLGRVTVVHRGLGVLDIQFPYGSERLFPDDIVKVHPASSSWFPPALMDQTYLTLDTQKARELWASAAALKLWRTTEVPQGFHLDLARLWTKGASEVQAYDDLWRKYAAYGAADDDIKDEAGKFYLVGRNLASAFVQEFARRSAAYWVAQNRQYRVTKKEHVGRTPLCPKCGTALKKTTYKMDKGAKHRLFACPKDLFLIKQDSILGPSGEPVEW